MRGGVCESNRPRRGKLFPFFERGEQGVRSLVNVAAVAFKYLMTPMTFSTSDTVAWFTGTCKSEVQAEESPRTWLAHWRLPLQLR